MTSAGSDMRAAPAEVGRDVGGVSVAALVG